MTGLDNRALREVLPSPVALPFWDAVRHGRGGTTAAGAMQSWTGALEAAIRYQGAVTLAAVRVLRPEALEHGGFRKIVDKLNRASLGDWWNLCRTGAAAISGGGDHGTQSLHAWMQQPVDRLPRHEWVAQKLISVRNDVAHHRLNPLDAETHVAAERALDDLRRFLSDATWMRECLLVECTRADGMEHGGFDGEFAIHHGTDRRAERVDAHWDVETRAQPQRKRLYLADRSGGALLPLFPLLAVPQKGDSSDILMIDESETAELLLKSHSGGTAEAYLLDASARTLAGYSHGKRLELVRMRGCEQVFAEERRRLDDDAARAGGRGKQPASDSTSARRVDSGAARRADPPTAKRAETPQPAARREARAPAPNPSAWEAPQAERWQAPNPEPKEAAWSDAPAEASNERSDGHRDAVRGWPGLFGRRSTETPSGPRRGHARIGRDEDHRRAAAVALAAYDMHSNPPERRTWWRGLKRFGLITTLVVASVIALLAVGVIVVVIWASLQ